jgi:hypothetical protein
MDELQRSDFTPATQTENCFSTVLSRQNSNNGGTEVDNQVKMA